MHIELYVVHFETKLKTPEMVNMQEYCVILGHHVGGWQVGWLAASYYMYTWTGCVEWLALMFVFVWWEEACVGSHSSKS